jgi:hypothetical protein
VPSSDFDARICGLRIDEENISGLADTYHVSREVILRKFLDRDAVSQRYYQERVADWRRATKSRPPGGNYYATTGVYLSDRYMEKAFSRYHRDQIGIDQLADYLGVKVKSVPGLKRPCFVGAVLHNLCAGYWSAAFAEQLTRRQILTKKMCSGVGAMAEC